MPETGEDMRILVPVDGSAAAQHAVAHALWLAHGRAGGMIVLLNVQNRETLGLSDIDAHAEQELELAAMRSALELDDAVRTCEAADMPFEARAEFGPVAETIDRIAREDHADHIVMGTRGLGRVGGLLLGSVSTAVIRLTDLPVTLVKRTTHAQPSSGASEKPPAP
jgi:nucleotide-binding universal stress UspA family protein